MGQRMPLEIVPTFLVFCIFLSPEYRFQRIKVDFEPKLTRKRNFTLYYTKKTRAFQYFFKNTEKIFIFLQKSIAKLERVWYNNERGTKSAAK
jgi:hypothetical protein